MKIYNKALIFCVAFSSILSNGTTFAESRGVLFMSKQQTELLKKVTALYAGEIISDWRPNSLINTKTGKNLEVDIYIPDLKIGIEFQGGVHFKNIKKYGNDSDSIRQHDIIKLNMTLSRTSAPSIIEVYESDLKGDFRNNFLLRINNTIEYYLMNGKIGKSRRLEQFYLYIKYVYPYTNIGFSCDTIFEKTKKTKYPICQRSIKYIGRMSDGFQKMMSMNFDTVEAYNFAKEPLCFPPCSCNERTITTLSFFKDCITSIRKINS